MISGISGQFSEIFQSLGIGEFSLQKYLFLVLALLFVVTIIPVSIAMLRGAGHRVAAASARDVLLGALCAVGVITIPGFFYFIGRGYITAFTVSES